MKGLHLVAWILLIIGGLNWFLIGVGAGDVVAYLGSTVARIVYVLVGLSALLELFTHKNNCKLCKSSSDMPSGM